MSPEEIIVRHVLELSPVVESIVLFGSRARGDFRPDSDWDVLVAVHGDGLSAYTIGVEFGRKELFVAGGVVNFTVRPGRFLSVPPFDRYFSDVRRDGITLHGRDVLDYPEPVSPWMKH